MSPVHRILVPIIAAVALSACTTSGAGQRIEELERERQDLARRNQDLLADYTACKARCAALERQLTEKEKKADSQQPALPEDLAGQGIRMKTNGLGQIVIDVPSDIFFGSGISKLSTGGEKVLRQLSEYISERYPSASLRVDGHADSDPIRRTKGRYHCNWDLSLERAHSVVHFLVDKMKYDPRKIVCAGYGNYRPQDPSNKARNRRVEIVIFQH